MRGSWTIRDSLRPRLFEPVQAIVNVLKRSSWTVISALVEGNSIRSIERMTGVHRGTIMRLTNRVGEGCQRLLEDGYGGFRAASSR
jgi:transposase